ncbi:hypothetical protein Q4520_08970 [Alteromonas sp. 1_MG-2023]|uniref:hypothetical protein n=1 Tax=Alteromonas sp. 1_MG-2023 TaxID=3062669 RepID=UPI0026E119A1|nr:hypothetical protein [Alteromonas sp. 1_MG-2023]MDO6475553.1 hypothetical protein [Alteromonas sp. 1_MG-2023]
MNTGNTRERLSQTLGRVIDEGLHQFTVAEAALLLSKRLGTPSNQKLKKAIYQVAKRLVIRGKLRKVSTGGKEVYFTVCDRDFEFSKNSTKTNKKKACKNVDFTEMQDELTALEDEYFTKMEAANFCLNKIEAYPHLREKLTALHQIKKQESLIALGRSEILTALIEG